MIWAGVPHPWLGRCWNRPRESASLASPRSGRSIREDSWIAVATAMIQPRTGTLMRAPTPTMMAALPTAWLSQAPTGGKPPGGGVSPPAGSEPLRAGMAVQEALAAPPTRPASRPPQASTIIATPAPNAATIRTLIGWLPSGAGRGARPSGWWEVPGCAQAWWESFGAGLGLPAFGTGVGQVGGGGAAARRAARAGALRRWRRRALHSGECLAGVWVGAQLRWAGRRRPGRAVDVPEPPGPAPGSASCRRRAGWVSGR